MCTLPPGYRFEALARADACRSLGLDRLLAALDKDYQLQKTQREQAVQIRQRALVMLQQLSQEKNLLYQKVGSYRAVSSHLEQLERQLRSSMPQHVMDMLGQQAAYLPR